MRLRDHGYEIGVRAARALSWIGRSPKWRRGVEGRRASLGRFRDWASRERDAAVPLVWVHAPSVGEALMAQAIIGRLRERAVCQVAFTWFSPSAERVADLVGADVTAYLPWDTRADDRAALEVLEPAVIAFVRTEIWPTLIREARARGVANVLINAPLGPDSSRLRPAARVLLADAYAALDAVGAVDEEDAHRFPQIGVAADRIRITGDARFDQAWARARSIDPGRDHLRRFASDGVPVVVAGSTWPEDETRLIPAYDAIRRSRAVRLIVAPHEPSPAHLAALEARLSSLPWRHVRLGALDGAGPVTADVVIVDRVGVLAELYAIAHVAYVGGGFGNDGLHSVVEPAALGVPVVFGERVGNTREALSLAAADGAMQVSSAEGIESALRALLDDHDAGKDARAFVESRLGADVRNADIILEALVSREPGHRRKGNTG